MFAVAAEYEAEGMVAQVEVAGNNAHSFVDGIFAIGTTGEPGMLHGHVIGRGDPAACYAESKSVLGGPPPGRLFNMRGDGTDDGNKSKLKWTEVDMRKFAARLARGLARQVTLGSSVISMRILTTV